MSRRLVVLAVIGLGLAARPGAAAEPQRAVPTPVTFRDAVDRAVQHNPSVKQAAEQILRADALLQQARAQILPSVGAAAVSTTLNRGNEFNGTVTTPQNQFTATVAASALLYAPVQWALRAQAADNRTVAELAAADVRHQVAVATAQAYLAVIARQRVLEADQRALEVARAHYALARELRESGAGSRLNELRAEQSVSSDEVLVELVADALYSAQEALGVLVADEGPLTFADEPQLEVPPSLDAAIADMPNERTDLRLVVGQEDAAKRVVADSWKDWMPQVTGLFVPQYSHPETIFQPSLSWRAQVAASVPIFDGGFRRAERAQREVQLDETRIAYDQLLRQANSDVRSAQASVDSATRALASARAAAAQAHEVVDIVNVSFRVGATTNIEVIDAQRAARDADTAAAVAEDQLRQAKLALLVALGRFS
jgi:outer membrane protein TolC